MTTKNLLLGSAASMVVMTFHDKFVDRIQSLDIMDASSVTTAHRIAEDGMTKVPANKIGAVSAKLLDKMIDVQASESPYVEQVMPFLQQADAGLKAQIASYIENGDLSDDAKLDTTDEGDGGYKIDPALADQELDRNKLNGGSRHSRAGTGS